MGWRNVVFFFSSVGTAIGATLLFKEYVAPNYEGKHRLEGKTAIVTGSNQGIGKEVARDFAKRGARVIMACRNEEACQAAREEIALESRNRHVVCRKLDLASLASIREFVKRIKEEEVRLDILVNNAGIMRPPRMVTEDGFELQLGVNHLGPFLLTNLLLDLMKASAPSRIIVVTSVSHKNGEIFWPDINAEQEYIAAHAYCQSKLAIMLFVQELARRLKGTGVRVYAVHPGICYSSNLRYMDVYNSKWLGMVARPVLKIFSRTPRKGAQTILYAAIDPSLENDEASGKYYSDCKEDKPGKQVFDIAEAKKLWLLSEKWTRLKEAQSSLEKHDM